MADAPTKTVGILLEFTYEDMEVWYPLLRLREAGYRPLTIATEEGKIYTSKYGYPCKADICIDNVSSKTLDALVIPGGWAPDLMRRDRRFVQLVQDMVAIKKPVAAICRGVWMLCSAKCVRGRHLTSLISIKDDVENAGALFQDSSVVVDENIITSRTPPDLPDFCAALLKQL